MKKNRNIASLFQKHEAMAKKRADLVDEEAQIEEEEPPTLVVEATMKRKMHL